MPVCATPSDAFRLSVCMRASVSQSDVAHYLGHNLRGGFFFQCQRRLATRNAAAVEEGDAVQTRWDTWKKPPPH